MHTIIRDEAMPREAFTFYADRLNRLLIEAGGWLVTSHLVTW